MIFTNLCKKNILTYLLSTFISLLMFRKSKHPNLCRLPLIYQAIKLLFRTHSLPLVRSQLSHLALHTISCVQCMKHTKLCQFHNIF